MQQGKDEKSQNAQGPKAGQGAKSDLGAQDTGETKARTRRRNKANPDPIIAYNSRVKLGVLATPCVVASIATLYGAANGIDLIGGGTVMHYAAAFIGGLTAFVLLQMAFESKPVLLIDDEGIRCRRPDVGLIPWSAVVGIGTSKATLLRKVLMVAVDETELQEQAARHMKRRVGLFAAFSPQVAKFEGKMMGYPSINVPISYFNMSAAEFEKQLADKIKFHGKK
jgi:hypothetical protein